MPAEFDHSTVSKLQKLYKGDDIARGFFDWLAELERDATETSLDRIRHKIDISRGDAIALARQLADLGCADFIVGRRGQKSRLRWLCSRVSLGKVASGEASALEQTENPISDDEEELEAGVSVAKLPRLTIPEAKAALAASLGVPISSIEIIIKG